jgi:hypothetical protein
MTPIISPAHGRSASQRLSAYHHPGKKHVRLPQKTQQSEINITKENHAITRLLEDLSSIMSLEALNRVAQANYQISDNQFHRC